MVLSTLNDENRLYSFHTVPPHKMTIEEKQKIAGYEFAIYDKEQVDNFQENDYRPTKNGYRIQLSKYFFNNRWVWALNVLKNNWSVGGIHSKTKKEALGYLARKISKRIYISPTDESANFDDMENVFAVGPRV